MVEIKDIENFEEFKKSVDTATKRELILIRDSLIKSLAQYQRDCESIHKDQMKSYAEAKKIYGLMDESTKKQNKYLVDKAGSHIRETIAENDFFLLKLLEDIKYVIYKIEDIRR